MHSDSRMHSAYLLTSPLHEDDIVVELCAVLWTLLHPLAGSHTQPAPNFDVRSLGHRVVFDCKRLKPWPPRTWTLRWRGLCRRRSSLLLGLHLSSMPTAT